MHSFSETTFASVSGCTLNKIITTHYAAAFPAVNHISDLLLIIDECIINSYISISRNGKYVHGLQGHSVQ